MNGRTFIHLFFIVLGAIMAAYAIEAVLIPNNIIDGGVVGISMMIADSTGIALGLLLVALNLPFLYLGYKQIGKTFALSGLFGIVVMSVATRFLHHVEPLTHHEFLSPVFGGLMLGAGIGIVIKNGGLLDGTEAVAILINKKSSFSVGEIVLAVNVMIFSVAWGVYGFDTAMLSLVAYFVAFKTIDLIEKGFSDSKSVYIISENYEEIGSAINDRLGRGVTYLNGEGGFSGNSKKVIFAVITRLEETKLKAIILEKDDQAFLAIADINEVRGGRFKKRDIH